MLAATAWAGVAGAESAAAPTTAINGWASSVRIPIAPKALPPDLGGLCEDKPGGLAWIDRMQAELYRRMCLTAAGFDGFFGNARFDDEYEATHGRLAVGALWDQRDQWDPSVRFRVSAQLPQLNKRLNAFVGRVDPDEYVTELRDDFDSLPRQFSRPQDDAVLIGLGYRQPGRGGGHFSGSVGAKVGWPLGPYAKVNYHLNQPFLEHNLLRLNETVFWREGEGFGSTTRVDVDRLLVKDFLVRLTTLGTVSQDTEGVRWYSNATLYQSLGHGSALAYQAAVSGETAHEVAIGDYGLRVIYRRSITREWLFLELRTGVTWPRQNLLERRQSNLGVGVALEMLFGARERN